MLRVYYVQQWFNLSDMGGVMLDGVNRQLADKVCVSQPAPSWMRRSSTRPVPARTRLASAIRKRIKHGREISGTSTRKHTSVWIRRKASCTQHAPRRPALPTSACCPTYCTERSATCGAIATIKIGRHDSCKFEKHVGEQARRKNRTKS